MALKPDYTPDLEIADEPVAQALPPASSISPDAASRLQEALDAAKAPAIHFPFSPTWHDHADAYFDTSPIQPMMVAPAVIPFGSFGLVVGEPKVGKTDYMFSMLSRFASGTPFLGMEPLRPLVSVYIQCEVGFDIFRMRMRYMGVSDEIIIRGRGNLIFTDRFDSILTPDNIQLAVQQITSRLCGRLPDIIAIDPLRNVFDPGPHTGGENNNDAMIYFIRNLKALLRDKVNTNASLMVAHHTRKISYQERSKGAGAMMDTMAGAGSLRGMHDYMMMLSLEDPYDINNRTRIIDFECRSGVWEDPRSRPPGRIRTAKDPTGAWQILDNPHVDEDTRTTNNRLVREKKSDAILTFIFQEAKEHGRLYTRDALIKGLEDKFGLGGASAIRDRVDVLIQKWHIKLTSEAYRFGDFKQGKRPGDMYLVVYDTVMPDGRAVYATHCKSRNDNTYQEVNDIRIWQLND